MTEAISTIQETEKKSKGKNGGARPYSGRKIKVAPYVFREFITEKELWELVRVAKKQAVKSPHLMTYIFDQSFGRARQLVGLEGSEPGDAIKMGIVLVPPKTIHEDATEINVNG